MSVTVKTGGDLIEKRVAVFSKCNRYRYLLLIVWDDTKPVCQFIGLNPSTADEMKDDPTVRRCKSFAKDWGCGALMMTNLFAFRATDPSEMKKEANPIGEGTANDVGVIEAAKIASIRVAAWGVHGMHLGRSTAVAMLFAREKIGLDCLSLTESGAPGHPLYLPKTSCRMPFTLS